VKDIIESAKSLKAEVMSEIQPLKRELQYSETWEEELRDY